MIGLFIVMTVLFIAKLLIDYVTLKGGVVTITTVKGFLLGFDTEEVIEGWENQETKEIKEIRQVSFELTLGFVALIFTYQEEIIN